jgi:hypothetical protein
MGKDSVLFLRYKELYKIDYRSILQKYNRRLLCYHQKCITLSAGNTPTSQRAMEELMPSWRKLTSSELILHFACLKTKAFCAFVDE